MRTAQIVFASMVGFLLAGEGTAQSSATNFGSLSVAASSTATVTVSIPAAATLGTISVLTQGAPGLDFTNAGGGTCTAETVYAASSTCTVVVAFTPGHPGMRYGAVVLADINHNRMASAFVYGAGQGAAMGFLPGTPRTVMLNDQTFPEHIAVDGLGNVYLIDSLNNLNSVVKETLSATGQYTLSSLGSGLASPNGIAVDGAGDVYIADTYEFRVVKETLSATGYVQSTILNLPPANYPSEPYGIAVDGAGNLYLTDVSNKRVLKETLSGGAYTATTVPTTGLNASDGIAVDGNGNIYIADTFNNRVVEEALAAGTYTQSTVATGLSYPYGVAVDGSGNLYIADTLNNRVLFQTSSSTNPTNIGTGLTYPYGVAVDAYGKVYIADSGNHRALKEDFSVPPSLSFASSTEGATSSDSPQVAAIASLGNAALAFTSVTYPADFPEVQSAVDACTGSTSLAAGATCTVSVDFSPVGTGKSGGSAVLHEAIAITAGSNTLDIPVSGSETFSEAAAATPVLSLKTGTYSTQQSLTLTDATSGAVIYYTTNASTPTAASTKYSGAIAISQTTTINAIAVASGYTNSAVASATYTFTLPPAAAPVFSPKAGTYSTPQTVTLTDSTKGAVIYYTTNGSTPTASSTKYSAAIRVSGTETIQAIAVASGAANSPVASAAYTIQ